MYGLYKKFSDDTNINNKTGFNPEKNNPSGNRMIKIDGFSYSKRQIHNFKITIQNFNQRNFI